MDYLLYEAEDFASDDSYLSYYFRTDPKDVLFWEDWIRHHPERLDVITQADHLIALLTVQLPEQELQEEFGRIDRSLRGEAETPAPLRPRKKRRWLMATAVIPLAVVFFLLHKPAQTPLPGNLLERINTTGEPMSLTLEDGSLVRLDPGSKLSYPFHFPSNRRVVYLEGGGFFQVSKNAQRPFYVYDDDVVTHVLGTSFTIRKNPNNAQVEVDVLSGKVEVYKKAVVTPGDRVILTPNQRAVYRETEQRFETTLVERPQPVTRDTAVFNTATLADILQSYEKSYGIEIEVENEGIYNCHFSGDLSHMELYKQLDVICQSLDMSYEVIGTRILIRGKGCN